MNLAAALAENRSVLLIDSDPQGNSTTGLGISKSADRQTLYQVLLDSKPLEEAVVPLGFGGLSIVPADQNLVAANLDLIDAEHRERRLARALYNSSVPWDYIFIDCPPALDLLTVNALVAADSVLIPIECAFFALEGVSQLIDTIDRVKQAFNPSLQIEGILLTMYDDRTNLTRQVEADLREFFGDEVFRTVIPRSVRLAEAPSFGKPIFAYDPRSRGAQSYMELAKELIAHGQRHGAESAQGAG